MFQPSTIEQSIFSEPVIADTTDPASKIHENLSDHEKRIRKVERKYQKLVKICEKQSQIINDLRIDSHQTIENHSKRLIDHDEEIELLWDSLD